MGSRGQSKQKGVHRRQERLLKQWLKEDGIRIDDESWLPSFASRPAGVYFADESTEFTFYLLELSGPVQESKLGLREVEENNKEAADIWYREVLRKLTRASDPNDFRVEYARMKARAMHDDMI